jgi:hypothetical protein
VSGVHEISSAAIVPATREAADSALALASSDLGLSCPVVLRWFGYGESRPAGDDLALVSLQCSYAIDQTQTLQGHANALTSTVWLLASLAPKQAALIVCHEARHIWQHSEWSADDDARWERSEEDADSYASS